MRILWLSVNQGLYNSEQKSSYNGGGWISSLQKLFINKREHELALSFVTQKPLAIKKLDNTIYYPIYEPPKSFFAKIKEYYGGYKKYNKNKYIVQINKVIEDFKPDIIHLFGMENPLATILGKTNIPIVVHLQGLLAPYNNAFYPVDFNKTSFLFPFSIREWILRNGYIFAKKSLNIRGERERELFKNVEYTMGRTEWDFRVSQLLSTNSKYFHVNEVLRDIFYENAGKWKYQEKQFTIVSTISNTIYKGLDTILKTAKLLKQETGIDFVWNIVGISKNDRIVKFFEHNLDINSNNVNIKYKGVLKPEELCNELLNSHVYVHPSYIDNSPNSLCEAQLLGMPVIGTYVGGIPSLIENNKTGLLVPANAPFELSYIIKDYSKNKEKLILLGENGKAKALIRHNKNDIINSLINTYETIIQADANI